MSGCTSSACHQGRKPCPTPEACRAPLGATDRDSFETVAYVVTGGIVGACIVASILILRLWSS